MGNNGITTVDTIATSFQLAADNPLTSKNNQRPHRLAVILVNYHGTQDTIECVRSLRKSAFTDFALYIVDNASGSEALATLARECPDATLIANASNLGFAKGNNIGIAQALQEGARFILLLNNDTIVEPSLLAALLEALQRHPSAGIAGAKIRYFNRPSTLWFAGGVLNDRSGRGRHMGIGEEDRGQYDQERFVDFVTGCCLLVRREVIDRIGMLDEEYFAYYEDSDFCLRARRAGFQVVFTPSARLLHKVSGTAVREGPVYLYFTLRNRLLFLRKNTPFLRVIPFLPALAYFYLRHFVRLSLKWRSAARTKAALYGFADGLLGRTGVDGRGHLDLFR